MKKQLLEFFSTTKKSLWKFENNNAVYKTRSTTIIVKKISDTKYEVTILRDNSNNTISIKETWFNKTFSFTISNKLFAATSHLYKKVQELHGYKEVLKKLDEVSKLGK